MMSIGMAMRSPRQLSLAAQVQSYLRSINGTLLVANPNNLSVMENGTGAATEGSFIGYMRDLTSTRHATQSTTAAKPKLVKAPTKLGAELVTNGDFSAGTAGWNNLLSTISVVSGQLNMAVTGLYGGTSGQCNVVGGKTYLVSVQGVSLPATSILKVQGAVSAPYSQTIPNGGTLSYRVTSSATGTLGLSIECVGYTAPVTLVVDNISVKEVLEESWALEFDGVNDSMATGYLASTSEPNYTLLTCYSTQNRSGYRLAASLIPASAVNNSAAILGEINTSAFLSQYGNDLDVLNPVQTGTPFVLCGRSGASLGRAIRVNGAQFASAAYEPLSSVSRELRLGRGVSAGFLQGLVFAAVYAPISIPDDKLKMIETYMGTLCGVTIP